LLKEAAKAKRRRSKSGEDSARLELGLDEGEEDEDEFGRVVSRSAKEQLLENAETMERSGRKLDRGQQLMAEAEATGAGILSDLAEQRETIRRARNRVRKFNGLLS